MTSKLTFKLIFIIYSALIVFHGTLINFINIIKSEEHFIIFFPINFAQNYLIIECRKKSASNFVYRSIHSHLKKFSSLLVEIEVDVEKSLYSGQFVVLMQ